jgi:cold shock CspA family protein
MEGTVSQWIDDKGFGFILPEEGTEKIFFHVSSVKTNSRRPKVGDKVLFDAGRDSQNRLRAKGVVIEGLQISTANYSRARSDFKRVKETNSRSYNFSSIIFVVLVLMFFYYYASSFKPYSTTLDTDVSNVVVIQQSQPSQSVIQSLFQNRQSNVQVTGSGVVERVLADDNDGSKHQRFILRLPSGQTVLITHNIDLAPRIGSLSSNDSVIFNGEYEWNSQGGVVHWTHKDPNGQHVDGSLIHKGRTYQ